MTSVNVTAVTNTVTVTEGDTTVVTVTTAGPQGATGATGATGPAGQGVAAGGTAGQVLAKASATNYDTTWITVAGTGTVTSVATGTGLTGGPITTTGTISLANTAVTPNTYNLATITVDQQGRITSASTGAVDLAYDAATRLLSSSGGTDVTLPLATTTDAGLESAADKSKLDGIQAGATANATDAQLRDRSTHTGTQAASTITGLATVATSGAYVDLSGKPTLGTAASQNVGTSAGNVVQLDGSAKLPAVDGSALTNLPIAPTNLTYTAATRLLESSTGTDVTLPLFTSTDAGLVSGSGGGTSNFLRADGTWAAPVSAPAPARAAALYFNTFCM